ncbi:MAG: VCBS repeat-containing protein [Desulfuromonadales bacterium]|nr:VCBS repeat-containing protein [Desulfuromonadales bacterium]
MKLCAKLILFFSLCCPLTAFAELPEQVKADFAVLNGLIIMQIGEEYVVDLDASDRLREGDILTLVAPGEKIIHPETREVIGSVDIPTGYLQVTRIKSGYSYAKLLSAEAEPQTGAQVRRFEQVPTLFVDNKGDEGVLSRQLRMDLPQLKWLQHSDTDQVLLTFILEADTLVVKTFGGNLLHSYSMLASQQLATPSVSAGRPFVTHRPKAEPKLLQKVANSLMGTLNLDDDYSGGAGAGIIRQGDAAQQGVWMGPNLNGSPVGIAVADLDGDGLQETAVALDNKVLISQISQGQYNEKAEIGVPARLQLLSLDAIDLDKNGLPELYLTAVDGYQLSSFVVQFRDGDYEIAIDHINWYLRVVELPGKGLELIGQKMGLGEKSFAGKPFSIQLEGNRLVRGDNIDLPGQINLFSFTSFTDKGSRLYYAYLTADDHLMVVSAAGEKLWESSEYYGGSESCFDNREGDRGDLVAPTCIRSRLVKTVDNEILVAQNQGQRILQRYNRYKESRLVSLSWNGYTLVENWRTAGQRGYLGDFALADADNDGELELVMAVKFKHKGITAEARSAVVIYDLN